MNLYRTGNMSLRSIVGHTKSVTCFSVGFTLAFLVFSLSKHYQRDSILQFRLTRDYTPRYFYSSTNVTRVNKTESIVIGDKNYRSQFTELWENLNPSIGLDFLDDPRKYVIYRCGPGMLGCGGWADRVKGMILGYILANLTGRVFKIDHHDPDCDITNALIPNKVDWRLPKPFHELVKFDNPPKDSVVLDYLRHPGLIMPFIKINVSQLFNQDIPFLYMKANLDHMDQIKKTTIYSHQLSWMRDLRKDQIFSEMYRRMFRYSPNFQKRLRLFLNQHLPTPKHKLICAHIRMGQNPTIPQKYEQVRMRPEFLPTVWDFISRHSTSDLHKVFVMTDSNDTLSEVRRQHFAPRLVSSPGNILHIEHARKNGNEARCQALEKVIFDQAVLMNCDTLLISKSGLSRMAAFVRGSDEGLYCLFPWGNITKCAANEFTELYHISG